MKKNLLCIIAIIILLTAILSSCGECEHEWESRITPATCDSIGYDSVVCKKCGYSEVMDWIPQLEHTYVESVEKAPTCDIWHGLGDKRLTCTMCDYSYIEYNSIPATEHTSGGAATCTTAEICTVCNAIINYSLGHSYEGTTDGTCTKCDAGVKFIFQTLPKTIHCTSGYNKTCAIESIKIERKQKYSSSTYEITFIVESTYHEKGNNYSDYACFGWKLYDEDGIVVSSGTKYSANIKVGEKTKITSTFYVGEDEYLQDGKTYRFELLNIN